MRNPPMNLVDVLDHMDLLKPIAWDSCDADRVVDAPIYLFALVIPHTVHCHGLRLKRSVMVLASTGFGAIECTSTIPH